MTVGELKKSLENIENTSNVYFSYDCNLCRGEVYSIEVDENGDTILYEE